MTYLIENKRVCLQKTGSWVRHEMREADGGWFVPRRLGLVEAIGHAAVGLGRRRADVR